MSTAHIPHLYSVPSVGPVAGGGMGGDDLNTPCGGCQTLIPQGQEIVKYRRSWWHDTCAARDIASGNTKAAWLSLGHDLARSPSTYRVKSTRAIVGALLGMIYDEDQVVVDDYSESELDGTS